MNNPKISIIITTYNRVRFLPEAIESVLSQSFADWEMIIIDDASTDNTKEVVERYCAGDGRIRYYRNQKNLKISKSRNRGLSLAVGAYVAVLDSDDAWCNADKLSLQYAFLQKNLDHALVGGAVVVVDEYGKEKTRYKNPLSNDALRRSILLRNPFAHSSVIYNRDIVLTLGGYDDTLNVDEDYDLWLRIGKEFKFANIDSYVLNYRVHANNISVTDRLRSMEINLSLIKKYRNKFPSYYRAMIRRIMRLWAYRLLTKIKRNVQSCA